MMAKLFCGTVAKQQCQKKLKLKVHLINRTRTFSRFLFSLILDISMNKVYSWTRRLNVAYIF